MSLLLALVAHPALAGPKVLVVKSSDLGAYSSVVAGFSAELRGEVQEVTLEGGAQGAEQTFKRLASERPAMVLAIGPAAANGAKRTFGDVPVVFSMVPYYEKYGLEGPNVTGIALTSDLSTELATLRALSGKLVRVGVLEDPRYSAKVVEAAQALAGRHGLSVVPIEVDSAAKVDKALKAARGKVDALLMVADKTVGNTAVVKRLIDFSRAQRLPLVALSSSQVKEGALLSLSPSYTGIGQQAARLANRIIHEKIDPGALAVAQPESLELSVNLTTAQKIGAECELARGLLELAAQKGFALRVFP